MDSIINLEKLKEAAIEKAISGDFHSAINLNKEILVNYPDDTDTMMQLAHAYWQSGNITDAQKQYQLVIKMEPNNNLAKKKLALLKTLSKNEQLLHNRRKGKIVPITDLIEEPGKTKTVRLSSIGKPEHISLLSIGEEVQLKIRKRKIETRDYSGNFIGYVPDDISKRLMEFMQHEGQYEAYTFSVDKNEVKIFIHEIKKDKKFRHTPSFIYDDMPLHTLDEDEIAVGATPSPEETAIDESEEFAITAGEHLEKKHHKEEEEEESPEEKEGYHDEYEE